MKVLNEKANLTVGGAYETVEIAFPWLLLYTKQRCT